MIKRKRTASEELSHCLDKCCGMFPEVIVAKNIMIKCHNCANGVQVNGNSEKAQLDAMIDWHKQTRNIKEVKK